MKQICFILLCILSLQGYAQKSILHLTQPTLMHEVRETPSPLNGQHIAMNPLETSRRMPCFLSVQAPAVLHLMHLPIKMHSTPSKEIELFRL